MIKNNLYTRPNSLAFRVTVLVGITIFICLGAMSFIVIHSIERHFAEQDADELNEVFEAVQRKIEEAHKQNTLPSSILFQAVSGHHGVYYLVADKNGNTLFSSEGANLLMFPADITPNKTVEPSTLYLFDDGKHMLRGAKISITIPNEDKDFLYTVTVASNMEFHVNYMENFQKTLWGIIFFAGVIIVLAARFSVYRGHSPLRTLSRKIESITADKLDLRLDPAEVPVELATLVDSFNTMIERLEDGFEKLSHFSADIAHELRTPITNLTTHTQVALSKPRDASHYQEVLYSNLEEYERMTKMVSDMLLLAQTEHGLIKPNHTIINVKSELKELFEFFELLADEKGIRLGLMGPDIKIICDKSMLRQALGNLISNSIRYSPKNEVVTVVTAKLQEGVEISITNMGDAIEPQHIPRLFDRFYRTDPSRKRDGQGAGLGLTIAKSIIEINSGSIAVSSSDNGTTFTVHFPNISDQKD